MKYKLLALDIDGTLVGADHKLPPENKAAVHKAVEKGINVMLCSGRSYASVRGFVEQLELTRPNNFAATFNGCIVHNTNTNKIVHDQKLPTAIALEIIENLKSFDGVEPVMYTDIYKILAYTKRMWADHYIKTCGATPTYTDDFSAHTPKAIYKIIALGDNAILKGVERHYDAIPNKPFATSFTGEYLYEFFNPNANKGVALQKVCDILGINISEAIAVGDSDNDISMIQAAGLGVAMQNANANVQSYADYITINDCPNFGVKEVIEKFIL